LTSLLQQQQQQQQQQQHSEQQQQPQQQQLSTSHDYNSSASQHQQQLHRPAAADDDGNDPFAQNRAKKAAKRDKFLGRERQQQQLEQLRALVSEPKPSVSSAGADVSRTNASNTGGGGAQGGGWGVKVTGASFFCKAADEAAAQRQVNFTCDLLRVIIVHIYFILPDAEGNRQGHHQAQDQEQQVGG
jgi:hypothetical protein